MHQQTSPDKALSRVEAGTVWTSSVVRLVEISPRRAFTTNESVDMNAEMSQDGSQDPTPAQDNSGGTSTIKQPASKPTQTSASPSTETKKPWNWRVVLIDDQDHSYDYVVRMTMQLFGFDQQRALSVATTVDNDGRAVLTTAHRELAELKREQVMEFGRDPMVSSSKAGMTAVLEPAE